MTTTKPWCNYAGHRTVSVRRGAGRRSNRPHHGLGKRRANTLADRWWAQAAPCNH